MTKRILWMMAAFTALAAFPCAAADSLIKLAGHVPALLQNAVALESAAADEPVPLSLAVHLDDTLLRATLDQIYGQDPRSLRHFLSTTEFARRFGLEEKRKALKDFAAANGLTVDPAEDKPESMVVKVSGSAEAVEKAFHVSLAHYRDAKGQIFRAAAADPMVPASLAPHLSAVLGLSNAGGFMHPHLRVAPNPVKLGSAARAPAAAVSPSAISGGTGLPAGALAPADIKTIYGLNSSGLNGAGQTVALFELDGYDPADIASYEAHYGLPNIPLSFIGVDGTTNRCGGISCSAQDPTIDEDMVEVALDIEMVAAIAPGLSRMYVYDGPNTGQGVYDLYNAIATDNLSKVVSTSWGSPELSAGSAFAQAEAQIFQRMAIQGQSIYAASGDNGANDNGHTLGVDDPASQPYMTATGGTTLTGSLAAPVETSWVDGGGGVSAIWPIPSYQVGVPGLASQQFRNVPDIALNADPASGYSVFAGGFAFQVGGTSAAAPLWAGLTALVNQQRIGYGTGYFGFANSALYQLGTSTSAATLFNDITSGNNGFYSAAAGYDNTTGFGSFKGETFILSASETAALVILESLANVYAYPNPWDSRLTHGNRQVTIANLPDGATVKFFTLAGFWVKTIPASGGSAVWDLTNNGGDRVASGLYFYVVNTSAHMTKGEIAIIK